MSHNFFSSSPIRILFKNMDGSHPYEGPRVGLSLIEAGKTKLWIVFGLRTPRLMPSDPHQVGASKFLPPARFY